MLRFGPDGRLLLYLHEGDVKLYRPDDGLRVIAHGARDLAAFGDEIWVVQGNALARTSLAGELRATAPLPESAGARLVAAASGPPGAVWLGDPGYELHLDADQLAPTELGGGLRAAASIGPRVWLLARAGDLVVRSPGHEHRLAAAPGEVRDGAVALGGRAALFLVEDALALVWLNGAGTVTWAVPGAREVYASAAGAAAVVRTREGLLLCDLMTGVIAGLPLVPVDDVALSPDAKFLATSRGGVVTVEPVAPLWRSLPGRPAPEVPPPRVGPAALRPRPGTRRCARERALAVLDAQLALVSAWAERAICQGWDTGRIAVPQGRFPFEQEVAGLAGHGGGAALPELAEASARVVVRAAAVAAATPGDGIAPLDELGAEFSLSPVAHDILLVAAGPLVRGELARLYGILANDPGRPLVDELLVAHILELGGASRHDIARELEPQAPLLRYGLVQASGKVRPFLSLVVDPLVIRRLRGEPTDPSTGEPAAVYPATRTLEQLRTAGDVVADLLRRLDEIGTAAPLRLVVRGSVGSGRRTLLAALARTADRELGVIDVKLLPAADSLHLAESLAAELRRATLRGWLPCVSGLDELASEDRLLRERLRVVLRAHPEPLALRLDSRTPPPLDPGYAEVALPRLDELERLACWQDALARRALAAGDAARLARSYRVGPGIIEHVVEGVARVPGDVTGAAEAAVRQHLDVRLAAVAERIDQLPALADVILPPDVMESLHELIARVRHRHQVQERWGMGRLLSTARGITALFSGGPGTGKTMVAGAIARELNLDLYRIDLSRIMSKWIGETEQNLARVFDAAEDGQAIVLFDEADSLFAKRTEVKSSVDRYSNLEVNYLLSRLDSFDGIALLTTNFGTAIDGAFKRRLSFRINFPFPDEERRVELWRAHLPGELPTTGELDLARLAHKYQLSGGYIRNAAVRAAFLAAARGEALSQAHLERAVELEFRDMGKLAQSGVLE
jgi:ATPase family protein associated with various cellular activities (AAA)/winged helix domain-containing protein